MTLKYKTLKIWKFKSRLHAQEYLSFQRRGGNKMVGARVRMRKYPEHKWTNSVGNVAVIKTGQNPGGDVYLFEDGAIRNEALDETKELV